MTMTRMRTSRTLSCCGLGALLCLVTGCVPSVEGSAGQAGEATLRIVTLSAARPYLVSGGDLLVRVEADDTVRLRDVVVLLDDEDVTRRFRPDPGRHALLGLVTGLRADTSGDDTVTKVVRARPASLVDACWDNRDGGHLKVDGLQTYDGEGLCNDLYPAFPTARHVAGAPLANNVVKCALKPISPDDYAVTFTADERAWLERSFPDGVCDWSQHGMYSGALRGTWLSFGPLPVNRVR